MLIFSVRAPREASSAQQVAIEPINRPSAGSNNQGMIRDQSGAKCAKSEQKRTKSENLGFWAPLVALEAVNIFWAARWPGHRMRWIFLFFSEMVISAQTLPNVYKRSSKLILGGFMPLWRKYTQRIIREQRTSQFFILF